MILQWLEAAGGLGLFLLAMMVMSEGLRGLAGEALLAWLNRATRSPATGALSGTIVTALLQSSSATIVTTVGLVAAGLLTFPQALGVVLGANVGTTVTGWLVASLGFKLSLGTAAYPLIFAGVLIRMFGRNKWSEGGKALAGFGLLFVGLGLMQSGMLGLTDLIRPDVFPDDTLVGRLLLIAIGAGLTMITQSSSAGVALAMTALAVGSLNFSQAAAMVIGMDVGTTITAVLATVGSSAAARRTGYSHTVYNLFSVVLALLLLSPYIWLINSVSSGWLDNNPALALAGFHTLFNLLALIIGLPLATALGRLMNVLVPDSKHKLARRLDTRLLAQQQAALAAVNATLRDEFNYVLTACHQLLERADAQLKPSLADAHTDFSDTRIFIEAVRGTDSGQHSRELATAIHALDHLQRMLRRLHRPEPIGTLRESKKFSSQVFEFTKMCQQIAGKEHDPIEPDIYQLSKDSATRARESLDAVRDEIIGLTVNKELSIHRTGELLAAYRWLERMQHHIWRITAHLGGFDQDFIETYVMESNR